MSKKLFSLLMIVILLMSMTACGGSSNENNCITLLKGNLDEIYLGEYNEDYLKLVKSTVAECTENYEAGLATEAEYFAYYYDIEYLTDELKSEIVDMYKIIYSYSKYTVGAASKLDDKTYAVKLEINPINIFELVDEIFDEKIQDFYEIYDGVDVEAMSEEEYMLYDYAWAKCIIDMCYTAMPNIGHGEAQSLAVQITKGSDDIWRIADNDMAAIDNLIITYP